MKEFKTPGILIKIIDHKINKGRTKRIHEHKIANISPIVPILND